jgi:hypothetical protein
MKLRVVVTTPPGQAKEAQFRLRAFLLGIQRPTETGYTEDSFYWELDASVKAYLNMQKRIMLFGQMCSGLMDAKLFIKAAKSLGSSKEDIEKVRKMLVKGTRVDIIKNATAEEFVEGTTTYWEKLKAKFTREA